MEILILLIPLGVLIALGIGAAFWWSAENGQFDDLDSPGHRILMDDDQPARKAPEAIEKESVSGPVRRT